MNKVVLIGRFTKDPELRFTPGKGTGVTTFTLAVDKYNSATKEKEADFISVVAWGKQAESIANYMKKGSQIAVIGRIQTRSYEDKDGKKRYIVEVLAQEVEFIGGKKSDSNASNNTIDNDIQPIDDGDVPF